MKRLISASFIALVIIGGLGTGFYYFKKYRNVSDLAINAIPPDAAFFIDFYADAGNLKKILNSNYFADGRSEPILNKLVHAISHLDSVINSNHSLQELLKAGHLIISCHVTRAADFDLLYLMSLPPGYSGADCADLLKNFGNDPDVNLQTRNYDGVSIYEWPLVNGTSFTFTVTNGVFAGSFTAFLVEDAIRQQKLKKPFGGDKAFLSMYKIQSQHHEDKIYFRYGSLSKWFSIFTDAEINGSFSMLSGFGSWTCLALQAETDHLSFKGFTSEADSLMFLNIFKNQTPVRMELPRILPSRTAAFMYFGFSDANSYFQSLEQLQIKAPLGVKKERYLHTLDAAYQISIRDQFQSWISNEYALVITEPASTGYDNNVLAIFASHDTNRALKSMRDLSERVAVKQGVSRTEEKYNGHIIGLVNLKDVLPSLYGELFQKLNKLFYTSVNGYVIFANQASALRSFIDDYESDRLLFQNKDHAVIYKQSETGNFCFYSRIPACGYILKSVTSDSFNQLWDQYKALSRWDGFGFLIRNTRAGLETSLEIQYAEKPASGVNLVWSAEIDTTIIAGPCFVPLGTGQNGVMVQDAYNQLYLLDNSGNIRWKKKLNETVKGTFHAIDLYKNGQVQYVFNTSSTLEMIDTAGVPFAGYPIRLPASATNPLAVFEFDGTGDYRIYIACNNGKIYAFQASGKPIAGWDFTSVTGNVSDPLIHFNHGGQDFLLINDNHGLVLIVNKVGQNVITVRQKLAKQSEIPFFMDDDQEGNYSFVTLDTAGNICSIMPDGFIRVHPVLEHESTLGFAMADFNHDDENDFLLNDGSQLSLYSLDSMSLFAKIPGGQAEKEILLFAMPGKELKIGTWSATLGKICLFNRDGSLYKGFPVKGNGPFEMGEINNDIKINILTVYNKEVLLYVLE